MFPDYIKRCLHKVACAEGMSKYTIESNAASKHGENFLGIVKAVTLTNTATGQPLHLIYKIPPHNRARRKHFKSVLPFGREIDVYTKLLPAFVQFQRDRGLRECDSFLSYPKLYAIESDVENDDYLLIMDDLRTKNFKLWPKEQMMPLNYVDRILIELGKFHAISYAMKDQRPNEFQKFQQFTDVLTKFTIQGKVKIFLDKAIDRAIGVIKHPMHKHIMEQFRGNYVEVIDEVLSGAMSKEYAVICHGDLWCNNFLFQSNVSAKKLFFFFKKLIQFLCRFSGISFKGQPVELHMLFRLANHKLYIACNRFALFHFYCNRSPISKAKLRSPNKRLLHIIEPNNSKAGQ